MKLNFGFLYSIEYFIIQLLYNKERRQFWSTRNLECKKTDCTNYVQASLKRNPEVNGYN